MHTYTQRMSHFLLRMYSSIDGYSLIDDNIFQKGYVVAWWANIWWTSKQLLLLPFGMLASKWSLRSYATANNYKMSLPSASTIDFPLAVDNYSRYHRLNIVLWNITYDTTVLYAVRWCHDMKTHSALLTYFDDDSTRRFPLQRVSDAGLWWLQCCLSGNKCW